MNERSQPNVHSLWIFSWRLSHFWEQLKSLVKNNTHPFSNNSTVAIIMSPKWPINCINWKQGCIFLQNIQNYFLRTYKIIITFSKRFPYPSIHWRHFLWLRLNIESWYKKNVSFFNSVSKKFWNLSILKSESIEMRHVQNLAISKKSEILVLFFMIFLWKW